jgi:hypothetical protein
MEMTVRGFVLYLLKETGVVDAHIVDVTIRAARENPDLKEIEKKYDQIAASYSRAVDQASVDQALAEFLRSWKPNGQPN